VLAALVPACAGRRPAEEAPVRPLPAPTAVVVATPLPAPTPTPVPPAIACASDGDCALTPYGRLVASAAACYCPTCPVARNAAVAAANEQSWQELCGAVWAERAGCRSPMCPRPVMPSCSSGACGDVSATAAPPG
jgi:hypothetical protein